MADEEVMTVAEVARRLRIHPVPLRKWLQAGGVRGGPLGATKAGWRIRGSEVGRLPSGDGGQTEGEALAAWPSGAKAARVIRPAGGVSTGRAAEIVESEDTLPTLRE